MLGTSNSAGFTRRLPTATPRLLRTCGGPGATCGVPRRSAASSGLAKRHAPSSTASRCDPGVCTPFKIAVPLQNAGGVSHSHL